MRMMAPRLRAGWLLALGTVWLVGCGGGGGGSPASNTRPPADNGSPSSEAPAPGGMQGPTDTLRPPVALGELFQPAQATDRSFTFSLACNAAASGARKVAFGVPFPRGYLTDASMVRIETPSGQEVAIDATELARWRHLSNAQIDGQSIRSVLVTLQHTCEPSTSSQYVLRWGVTRTKVANLGISPTNVRSTWGPQAAPLPGEHPATDNYARDTAAPPVLEPQVFAQLPAAWLMKSNIRGPVSPITDAAYLDRLIGFHKTYVNDVHHDVVNYEVEGTSGGLIDFRNEIEGWLFDRPFALWNVYIQTGDVKWLRHAHRATHYYKSYIALANDTPPYARGAWRKKPPSWSGDTGDAKYSHAGGLFAAYLLTGDAGLLDAMRAIAEFTQATVQFRLPPYAETDGLWTERHLAAGLAAALYTYEATGDAALKARLQSIMDGMQADVDAPPAGYPSKVQMAGVLLHRPEIHEGDSMPDMIMSPWMSALLMDVMMHYYLLSDDNRALGFMGNYAQFVATKGLYYGSSIALHVPWYLAGLKAGYTDNGEWDDFNHGPDVLGLLARGKWARSRLGLPTDTIDAALSRMRPTANFALNDAVRTATGLPRYRASPTRRVGWWFGTNGSLHYFGEY